MPAPLDVIADWPVPPPPQRWSARPVCWPATATRPGVFRLASVTKPLVARAAQVAVEEGVVDLDTPAGPPGSRCGICWPTPRGCRCSPRRCRPSPGTRRVYSNYGFAGAGRDNRASSPASSSAATWPRRSSSRWAWPPPGWTAARRRPGFGGVSTVADLAAFAADLLRTAHGVGADARRGDQRAVPRARRGAARLRHAAAQRLGPGLRDPRRQVPALDRRGNSPRTYGHFGQTGTFLWVDPGRDLALVVLTDRDFGEWAKPLWPALSDEVLSRVRLGLAQQGSQGHNRHVRHNCIFGNTRSLGKTSLVEPKEQVMRASNQFADATTGVVYLHASPAAVCPHVEWALSSTLDAGANLKWTPQPAMPGQLRAVTNWVGPVGTGARLANALRSWSVLRFEVTEDPSPGVDGQRFCHTPQLGLWSGAMSANGDIMVGEMRLRTLMAAGRGHAGGRIGHRAGHGLGRGAGALSRRRRRRRGQLAEPRSRLAPAQNGGGSVAFGDIGVVECAFTRDAIARGRRLVFVAGSASSACGGDGLRPSMVAAAWLIGRPTAGTAGGCRDW